MLFWSSTSQRAHPFSFMSPEFCQNSVCYLLHYVTAPDQTAMYLMNPKYKILAEEVEEETIKVEVKRKLRKVHKLKADCLFQTKMLEKVHRSNKSFIVNPKG